MLYNKILYLIKKFVFSSSYESSRALEYCGKMSEKHFELIYVQHVPSIIFINLQNYLEHVTITTYRNFYFVFE